MLDTKNKIIKTTKKVFARQGYDGVSMSIIAHKSDIAKSVIYHYFSGKDALLKEMFEHTSAELGRKREQIIWNKDAVGRLRQIIMFQFDHAEDVVAVLNYYTVFRSLFKKIESGGFVPMKAYRHIEEILEYGVSSGEFHVQDLRSDAKVITHAINGFVLEYFPHIPKGEEKQQVVGEIADFILRALITHSQSGKGVNR